MVERRTVAPNVAGSNPVSHPTSLMGSGFNRQLDIFFAFVAALVTFITCVFWVGISAIASATVAAIVLITGLILGRSISQILAKFLS